MNEQTPTSLNPSKPEGERAPQGALLPQKLAAEVKPRVKRSDKPADIFLKELAQKIAREGEAHQRQRAQLRDFCERQYAGGYGAYGRYDEQGRWTPRANTARLFPNSRFAFNVQNLKSQAESAVTRLDVTAVSGEEDKRGGAEFAARLIDEGQERLYTSSFRQTEWLRCMFHGEAYRYTRWDANAEGCYERVPVPTQTEEYMGGSFMCQCGAEGSEEEATEAGGCPECGQPANIIPGQSVPVTSYETFERKGTGHFVTESVDPLEMKRERGKPLRESRFLERRRLVHVSELEETYRNIEIPKAADVKSPGLLVLRALDSISPLGGLSDYSPRADEDYREYVQLWLRPRAYADYTFDVDTKLGVGVTVPAGVRLGEVFKTGLYLAMVGDTILDAQDENLDDFWTSFLYYTTTDGSGKGVIDGAFLGKTENELSSMLMEWALRDSTGWGIYNSDIFDGDLPDGTPGTYVPARLGVGQDALRASDVLQQIPGSTVGAGVERLLNFIVESGHYSMGSFPENAGATGGGTDTYSGLMTQIEQGNANQRPMLANKAECDRQTAFLWLKLCQKHLTGERYAQMNGRFGEASGRWFKACDLHGDFRISFERDSYMPQSGQQTRVRESAFNEQALPMAQILATLDPSHPMYGRIQGYLLSLESAYGITLEQDASKQDVRRAQLKLEKFRGECEQWMSKASAAVDHLNGGGMMVAPEVLPDPTTGQMVPNPEAGQLIPDPRAVAAVLSIVPNMPDIDGPGARTQIEFLRSAVISMDDDAQQNPLLVAVIRAEMQRLKGADVQDGQQQNASTLAKQAPMMQLQAAQAQQQQAAQAQGEQAKAEREDRHRAEDADREAQGREHEMAAKELEMGHESMQADEQRRHEAELMQMRPGA